MKPSVNPQIGEDKSAYCDAINSVFASHQFDFRRDRRFAADVKWIGVSDLKISQVNTSNQFAIREGRQVEKDSRDQFVLFSPLSGSINITQNKKELTVHTGNVGIYSLSHPSVWQHDDPANVLNLVIPGNMLRDRLFSSNKHDLFPNIYSSGLGRMSRELLVGLWSELDAISASNAEVCTGYLVDLIALAVEGGETYVPLNQEAARAALYHRCTSYIRTHLEDLDLDPVTIANYAGISVRYLHQIFNDADQTVCGYLRNARLERCYRELSRPQALALPISEIARRSGFRNPSHFATAFKRRYGVSPRERRRAANHTET